LGHLENLQKVAEVAQVLGLQRKKQLSAFSSFLFPNVKKTVSLQVWNIFDDPSEGGMRREPFVPSDEIHHPPSGEIPESTAEGSVLTLLAKSNCWELWVGTRSRSMVDGELWRKGGI